MYQKIRRDAPSLMRIRCFCLAVFVGFGLISCSRSNAVTVVSEDLITFRLPDGRTFQVDILGEPLTGRNNPFQMSLETESKSQIRISIEDVLYFDKSNGAYEVVAVGDPIVFKQNSVPLMYQDSRGNTIWSIGTEPSTLSDGGPQGPQARQIGTAGHLLFADRKAISEISATRPVLLHFATSGKRKLEFASPYRIVNVRHARDGR